jgi:hypothetical protein
LTTTIIELDQFSWNGDTEFSDDEQIQITGTDHNGIAIAQVNLSVNSNTKLSHLIDEINDAFDGIAKARLENGKIVLTDGTAGASSLSIALTYDEGSGGTTLTPLGLSVTTEGGGHRAANTGIGLSRVLYDFSSRGIKCPMVVGLTGLNCPAGHDPLVTCDPPGWADPRRADTHLPCIWFGTSQEMPRDVKRGRQIRSFCLYVSAADFAQKPHLVGYPCADNCKTRHRRAGGIDDEGELLTADAEAVGDRLHHRADNYRPAGCYPALHRPVRHALR